MKNSRNRKPTQPKRAGGQKDRLSPLDKIIARINEEFFGDFTDADRVMVDTLYTKMRQDAKVKKAAKSNDRQVYERSIFPGIFDTTAQQAYMENTEAYEQLFLVMRKNTASSGRRLPSGSIANCTETQNNGGAA